MKFPLPTLKVGSWKEKIGLKELRLVVGGGGGGGVEEKVMCMYENE